MFDYLQVLIPLSLIVLVCVMWACQKWKPTCHSCNSKMFEVVNSNYEIEDYICQNGTCSEFNEAKFPGFKFANS
jgi:hypothetical protein